MRLLLTRPNPDAERTAAALSARGHAVILAPLLRIDPLPDADLGSPPWGAVLITSANAARAIAAHDRLTELTPLPLYAVGRRSADVARAVGFATVVSADGDALALARLIAARLPRHHTLLYLAGEERAADLEGLLGREGFSLRTVVVYRAVAETQFSLEVQAALKASEIDAVLHFSARSAAAFLAAIAVAGCEPRLLNLRHFCLSEAVAAPLIAGGVTALAIAPDPSESALLDRLG
jgi:uroporphyrinogen-III synthase